MVDQGQSTNVGELSAQSPSTQRQDAFAEYIQTYGFKSFVSSLVRAASVVCPDVPAPQEAKDCSKVPQGAARVACQTFRG